MNKVIKRLNVVDENSSIDSEKKPLKLKDVTVTNSCEKKPLKMKIIDETVTNSCEKPLKLKDETVLNSCVKNDIAIKLNILDIQYPSDHMCYVLKSSDKRIYVGYTIDFNKRIRKHNGEIVGGAKKTEKGRPWVPICKIRGFYDNHSALRFEWRIQHSKKPRPNCISNIPIILKNLINKGDGLLSWPDLTIEWI